MSPRLTARMAGVFYVLEGLASVFGQLYVPGKLVVSGDAAATAANILAQVPLFRLGLAAALLAVAFHIAQTVRPGELCFARCQPVRRLDSWRHGA